MKVSILYFEGCPHWRGADERVRIALSDTGLARIEVECRRIATPSQAEAEHFTGSPTVALDGGDPFADLNSPVGMFCRLYSTDEGLSGSPSVAQLRSALRQASS